MLKMKGIEFTALYGITVALLTILLATIVIAFTNSIPVKATVPETIIKEGDPDELIRYKDQNSINIRCYRHRSSTVISCVRV